MSGQSKEARASDELCEAIAASSDPTEVNNLNADIYLIWARPVMSSLSGAAVETPLERRSLENTSFGMRRQNPVD